MRPTTAYRSSESASFEAVLNIGEYDRISSYPESRKGSKGMHIYGSSRPFYTSRRRHTQSRVTHRLPPCLLFFMRNLVGSDSSSGYTGAVINYLYQSGMRSPSGLTHVPPPTASHFALSDSSGNGGYHLELESSLGKAARCFEGVIEAFVGAWRIEVGVEPPKEGYAVMLAITRTHREKLCIMPLRTRMWCHTGDSGLHKEFMEVQRQVAGIYDIPAEDFDGVEKQITHLLQVHPQILQERFRFQMQSRIQAALVDSHSDPEQEAVRQTSMTLGSIHSDLAHSSYTGRVIPSIGDAADSRMRIGWRSGANPVANACQSDGFRAQIPEGKIRTHFGGWRIEVGVRPTVVSLPYTSRS